MKLDKDTDFCELIFTILDFGYTERSLAEKLGVSQATVTKWKNKETENPAFRSGMHLIEIYCDLIKQEAKRVEESRVNVVPIKFN